MGALHAGHDSLIAAARRNCDVVLVTIFVNPRQFSDALDLANYPRSPDADYARCERAGVDAVAAPTLAQMWPNGPGETATTVRVRGLSDVLEGVDRPGHFDGVASVVSKLFNVTGPCTAFFGEKDFQQLAVLRRMVSDLAVPVELVGCPTVRDADGLALSSRNARLTPAARTRALGLSRALRAVGDGVARPASEVRATVRATLSEAGLDVAYAEVVDPLTLAVLNDGDHGAARVLLAAVLDGVRLLDNGPVSVFGVEGVDHVARD